MQMKEIILGGFIVWMAGCLRNDVDGELATAQGEWRSRIESIKGREHELTAWASRVRDRISANGSSWNDAIRRRIDSSIIAGQQGLTDLDSEVERLALEVKASSDRGEALFDARMRMAGYLNAQEETLATIRNDIALAESGPPPVDTAPIAKGEAE
jgi:hypothetical protein